MTMPTVKQHVHQAMRSQRARIFQLHSFVVMGGLKTELAKKASVHRRPHIHRSPRLKKGMQKSHIASLPLPLRHSLKRKEEKETRNPGPFDSYQDSFVVFPFVDFSRGKREQETSWGHMGICKRD